MRACDNPLPCVLLSHVSAPTCRELHQGSSVIFTCECARSRHHDLTHHRRTSPTKRWSEHDCATTATPPTSSPPITMADSLPHAGIKRSHDALSYNHPDPGAKKRHIHHSLHRLQPLPAAIEPAPQDPVFTQGQLLRSIASALVLAGFDGVQPSALESFRALVEEYMLEFLQRVAGPMNNGRRVKPTALDWEMALAGMENTRTAEMLVPQVKLRIPDEVACPPVARKQGSGVGKGFEVPDFSGLLEPLAIPEERKPEYVPSHFPALPSRHAWMSTPVFPERERDARKMREKATQEGMLAEQALRRLATAAKAGALKAEEKRRKRSAEVLRGEGKARSRKGEGRGDIFADVLKDLGGFDGAEDMEMDTDAGGQEGIDVGMPEGVVVNCDMGHWRQGDSRRALRH
jgi:transcription initiation factor TFIID subunit 8